MVQMTITEYWNCLGIPRGELKAIVPIERSGYETIEQAVKEVSSRFGHKLAHKGRSEVVFAEPLYVQVISFK